MKAWFIVLLSLFGFELGAQTEAPLWNRTHSVNPKHDPKEDQKSPSFETLFFNTVDPALFLKDLPTKFIGLRDVEPYAESFISVGEYRPAHTAMKLTIPGFIYPQKVTPLGVVESGLETEVIIGERGHALVRTEGMVEKDKVYTILRPGHVRKDAIGKKWFQYTATGTAIVRKLEKTMKKSKELTAIIEVQRNSVAKAGDLIVPLLNLEREFIIKAAKRKHFPAKARVVTFTDADTEYGGENGIVYLDRGADSGLETNQLLDLYMDPVARDLVSKSPQLIGTVLIVDTTPHSSAAYVVASKFEVVVGDFATSEN